VLTGSKLYYTEETQNPDMEEDTDDDEPPDDVRQRFKFTHRFDVASLKLGADADFCSGIFP
jgi:hypothetical protein